MAFGLGKWDLTVDVVAVGSGLGGLSAGIVLAVALGSCLVPTRRILAIQASEAMHADG